MCTLNNRKSTGPNSVLTFILKKMRTYSLDLDLKYPQIMH